MEATQRLHSIVRFYRQQQRMPSVRELQRLWRFRSIHAAEKVVGKLLTLGLLGNDATGQLLPTRHFHAVRCLGAVEAGFPSAAAEELLDALALEEFLIRNKDATYLLRVTGESMIEAGILPGDLVLVERGLVAQDGDIVIAQIDRAWTMKYLRKRGRKVSLEAANTTYPPLYPTEEWHIVAVVIGVIRKYRDD